MSNQYSHHSKMNGNGASHATYPFDANQDDASQNAPPFHAPFSGARPHALAYAPIEHGESLAILAGGRARFRHPTLETDGVDRGENVELRWNFDAWPTGSIRVVIFLHGDAGKEQLKALEAHISSGNARKGFEDFLRRKTLGSGLVFNDAHATSKGYFPVLCITPRGMPSPQDLKRFDFRAFEPEPSRNIDTRQKVEALIQQSLREVEGALSAQPLGPLVPRDRRIKHEQVVIMAHGSGGAGMNTLLFNKVDPDGVACFDSTFGPSAPIRDWLAARFAQNPVGRIGGAPFHGPWLRVLVSQDSMCRTDDKTSKLDPRAEASAREIDLAIPVTERNVMRRVEHSTAHHRQVDRTYACPLALDMTSNLDGIRGFTVAPLSSVASICQIPLPPVSRSQPAPSQGMAEALASKHPIHIVTGDAPSKLFDEPDDPAKDMLFDKLGQLAGYSKLVSRGLVIAKAPVTASSTFRMRLRGCLVVPRDLAKRAEAVPIVFIVMGNHNAFDPFTGKDIENFTGYGYLQQHLADLGVASCSVDTNLANALNLDIRTRAEILLETMNLVATSAPADVKPKLDFKKTGLIGHSRGGEAVVLGALLAAARSLPYSIKCVGSIAPTDFSLGRKGGSIAGAVPVPLRLTDTRFFVLYGSHDGDVGDVLFNGFGLYDRAQCDKTIVYARGLTHNRFNTVWNECADYADGRHAFVDNATCRTQTGPFDQRIFASVVHREYANFFMGALVRRTLLGDASAEDVLRGLVAPTRTQLHQSPGLAGPAASVQWSVTSALTIDEFDVAGIGPRKPTGGSVERAFASPARETVPHLTRSFVANATGEKIRIDIPSTHKNLSKRRELTFRLTSMIPVTSESTIASAALPDWEVRVVSSKGASAARPTQLDTRGLRAPNKPFFHELNPLLGGNVTKNQYDTHSVLLSSFSNVDWTDVRAFEFEARSGAFPLILDSIAFV
jgi:hypothetical protein